MKDAKAKMELVAKSEMKKAVDQMKVTTDDLNKKVCFFLFLFLSLLCNQFLDL